MPKAKITMQAKREAVPEAFGDVPNLDPAHLNILYARRDLSTVQKGEAVGVRYIIDVQDLVKHRLALLLVLCSFWCCHLALVRMAGNRGYALV